MGNFNRDDRRPSGGGFSRGGSGYGGRPTMFKATCSECGAACELPFRPTGDRPVFCSDCFANQGHDSGRGSSFGDRRERGGDREEKRLYDATCDKCGSNFQLPFRPREGKPVYCEKCFEKTPRTSGGDNSELVGQIKMLHVKIDKLISILAPKSSTEKAPKAEAKKEKEVKLDNIIEEVIKEKKEKGKAKAAPKKEKSKKKK